MNNRGSITVFSILVMFGVIVAFSIYMNTLAQGLTENNGLRVLENASRNIQSAYDHALYFEYGLLAYEEESLKSEFDKSVESGLSGRSGMGILPFQTVTNYKKGYEKKQDLTQLDLVRDQMLAQALMNVPKEFLEHQDVVKSMFERAHNAKNKIKDINKITDKIEKLKKYNKKLGKCLNRAKKVEDWMTVYLSSKGKVRVSTSQLRNVQKDIEKSIANSLDDFREISDLIKVEKDNLEEEKTAYPDQFREEIEQQLDDFLVGNNAVALGEIDIEGIYVEKNYVNMVRSHFQSQTNDQTLVNDLMERYGYGLAAMKQTLSDIEDFEEDLKARYIDDLERIRSLREDGSEDDRKEAKALRKDVMKEMREDAKDFLEDIDVNISFPDDEKCNDRDLENYVEDTRSNELQGEKEAEDNMTKEDKAENLSENELTTQQMEELPSRQLKDNPYTYKALSQPMIVEYIMGTFRHRLTGTHEDPWDFYEKADRPTYFRDGEIEYILHGSAKEKTNRHWVAGEIFLIREGFNIVHVYTCKEKIALAKQFSTVVAHPAWTKPLYYHGLLVGWASLESALDVQSILKGEKVAVLKLSDKDWKTSIRGAKNSGGNNSSSKTVTNGSTGQSNSGSAKGKGTGKKSFKEKGQAYIKNMNMNEQGYDFYLRFLLNLKTFDQKKHVLRALDLIVVNKSSENAKVDDLISLEDYWTGHLLKLTWPEGGVEYEAEYD